MVKLNLIPNIPPKLFSFSAVAVGYLLIDDLTANEQNALGNWLMLTAQVLSTNAFYKQVQTDRNTQTENISKDDSIVLLQKMVDALTKEVNNLKQNRS